MGYAPCMRPEILFPLFAPAASLKGVGPKIAPLVERAAGPLVRDLLFLTPQGVIERPLTTVGQAEEGPVLGAVAHDSAGEIVADAADRGQAEADGLPAGAVGIGVEGGVR